MSTVALRGVPDDQRRSFRDIAVAVSTGAWMVLFVAYRLQLLGGVPHRVSQVALYGFPVALCAYSLRGGPRARLAAGSALVVLLAFLIEPKLIAKPLYAFAVPGVALAIAVAMRYPTVVLLIAVAVSSAFGDLEVYWHFPTQKVIDAVLVSLLVAIVISMRGKSRRVLVPRPLVLVLAAYLFITAVMVPLADSTSVALHDFSTSALYLLMVLAIAHAGWSEATLDRMARLLLIAALLVGAYASLRVAIGPSAREFAGNQSPYDYVNGHYRTIGSFHAPQDLGFWTSAMLPFTLAWSLGSRRWWRAMGLAATLLLAVGLYGSGLRIGLVAAGAGLLTTLLLYHFARGFPGLRLGVTLGVLVLSIGTGAVLFTVVHSTTPAHNYSALLHPNSDPSVIARKAKWTEAFRELRGRPFGFGMGAAFYAQGSNAPVTNIGAEAIDDGYLYVALEQGLFVMGIFVAGLLALVVELGRGSISARTRSAAMLGMGATGVLVSVLLSAIAEVPGQSLRLLVPCIAIGLGLAQFTTRRMPGDQAALAQPGPTTA